MVPSPGQQAAEDWSQGKGPRPGGRRVGPTTILALAGTFFSLLSASLGLVWIWGLVFSIIHSLIATMIWGILLKGISLSWRGGGYGKDGHVIRKPSP